MLGVGATKNIPVFNRLCLLPACFATLNTRLRWKAATTIRGTDYTGDGGSYGLT